MRVLNALIAVSLVLAALPASAADVVLMRDGSERSGTLELCAEDECKLSGKRIPIEEIQAIFLNGPRKQLPVRAAAVVMRDGSFRMGVVTFVSRGTVDIDDQEFDRSRVEAIIFGSAPAAAVSDLLILRNGSVKNGTLTKCSAASCTLDGTITPLADIEWVGLARPDLIPPSSTADEVHKIEGTVIPGRLSAIDATTVSTTRGRIPRAETAWVHVLPPPTRQPSQPGSFGAPPPPPQPPVQPPPPPPPPPSPRTSPQPPGAGSTPTAGHPTTPRGGGGPLWTGVVQSRIRVSNDDGTAQVDVDARVRLRERVYPLQVPTGTALKTLGTFSRLDHEGTVLRNRFRSPVPGGICHGEGSTTVSIPEDKDCSAIWVKKVDVDTTPVFGFNVPLGASYQVCIGKSNTTYYDVTCPSPNGPDIRPEGFSVTMIGRHPEVPGMPASLFLLSDPLVRMFSNGPGKMQGTYSRTVPTGDGWSTTVDVSWSICREGVQCSDPPPLPGEDGGGPGPGDRADGSKKDKDDCVTLGRLIDGIRALKDAYEAFEASFVEAERNRDAARDSIYGGSGSLAQFFTAFASLAAEGLSGSADDAIGLLLSAVGLAQDFNADNAAEAVVGLAGTDLAFSPAARQGVLEATRKADAVLKTTDLDHMALRTYAEQLGKSEAAQQQGKNIVKGISFVVSSKDFYDKADALADGIQNYLDYRSEAKGIRASMDDIQNQIEQKILEIQEIRDRIDEEDCPDASSTGAVLRRNRPNEASPYRFVQSATAAAEPPVTPEEVRTAAAALSRVEARMENAAPWLLPFFARATDGVSPRLLRLLLLQAAPDLRAIKTDLETATQAGRALERKLRQTSTNTTAE